MSLRVEIGLPDMSQYLLSVPHDSDEEPTMETMDPAELEAALAATGAIIEELTSIGAFVFAGGLTPPSSAITVDNTGESLSTVNGPFVEAPEYLGGFWVIDVADEKAALDWAARASKALGGRIEVRAFQPPPGE
ncbi:YciI family protein [Nocardioidaceae bacterium SCSIO 66511]|nr:YciI family protein [Nocardioidaceae bacterium SCSIO 66511]